MTLVNRVWLGILLGAVIVLSLQPSPRSLLFSGLVLRPGFTSVEPALVQPRSLGDAGRWMEAAADRVIRRLDMSTADWAKIDGILDAAIREDTNNAYWRQCRAVFWNARRKPQLALNEWSLAARASTWNNYEADYRTAQRSRRDPHNHAWSAAVAYRFNGDRTAHLIELLGRLVIRSAPQDTKVGLDRRFDTLRNGDVMRQFAKSAATGEYGARLVEVSAYPQDLAPMPGPRKLVFARIALHQAFQRAGRSIEADFADRAFRNNDAWSAFLETNVVTNTVTNFGWGAVAISCLPGSFLWVTIGGGILYLLGSLTNPSGHLAALLRWPTSIVIGLAVGVYLMLSQSNLLTGLAVSGAGAFVGWKPPKMRPAISLSLGPLYAMLLGALGLLLSLAIIMGAAGTSVVGAELCEVLGIPAEYYGGSTVAFGILALAIALLTLLGPAYGWAYRYDPAIIASSAFMEVGRRISGMALVLFVMSAPLAIYGDHRLSVELTKIIQNEPLYHLSE